MAYRRLVHLHRLAVRKLRYIELAPVITIKILPNCFSIKHSPPENYLGSVLRNSFDFV